MSLPTAPRGAVLRGRAPELTAADYTAPILPGRSFAQPEAVRSPLPGAAGRAAAGEGKLPSSWRELHFRMLERAGPPSLVINGEHEIVHMTEKAGQFLQLGGGELTTNLLRLIRPELRIELRAALFRAAQTGQPAESYRIPFPSEGEEKAVNIRVTPMNDLAPGFLLVVLELKGALAAGETAEPTGGERLGTGGGHAVSDDLDNELQQLKTHLRDTVEQHVADEEELKASNEELQAMNEELRSASEELETSREELQSLNEELSTVNQELKSRLEELGSVNGDLRNLMSSTQIATVFLDRELRIMRFTPSAVPIFNLIETDLGRPLTHLKHELEYPELERDARAVLERLVPMEREVSASGDRTFLARLLPYRTLEDRIAGVVLNFVNITDRRRAEQAVQENEHRLRTLADAVPQLIWANDGQGRANYFNLRWYEYTGLSYEESAGLGWEAVVHPEDAAASKAAWRDALAKGEVFDCEYRLRGGDGGYRWFIGRNVPLRNAAGHVTGWFGTATDIQALKEAEAARRAGEEQFRRAIEDAPIPVIVQAEDGKVLQISRTWTELTGFTREELPTFEAWLNRAYGPGAEEVREHVRRLFQDDESRVDAELDVATASGEVRRWSFSASAPGRLSDGRRFIVGMALDITERQRAEEALRASEERFRVALEAAEMAAWDLDVSTGAVIWNVQHYRLLGLKPDGQPKTAEDFFRHVHPDDAAMVQERMRIAAEETGVYHAEYRIIRSDDQSIRWMSGFGRAIAHESGRARRMTGVMFDTTERHLTEASLRAAEERVRLIVENARDFAIFAADLERRVTTWNPGAEAIFGYGEQEIVGQSGDVIFTLEDRAAGAPVHEAETALTEGRAADERWHLRKDGSRFWGSGVMMAMRDPAGRAIGLVKILRDMTEAREAQQALEESREDLWRALQDTERARAEAEAAGKAKDHFLAVLSHELRTPLTPVIMAVRTLSRRKDLPAPVADALEMIQRNVQLEAHFVDDLLDLPRIARGKMELVREPVDLHQVLRHANEVSRPDFEAKSQRLEAELSAESCTLNGDAKRLQQVFWNLAKNASKFTPDGGRVRVLSRNDASRIIVEVHDTGIGFPPEAAERIFDPFTQGSEDVTREFGGLGLGLAITKATVVAHGGTISAWSPGAGQGAIFAVSLPCT
jgi:PAS domain S-box-containing protein